MLEFHVDDVFENVPFPHWTDDQRLMKDILIEECRQRRSSLVVELAKIRPQNRGRMLCDLIEIMWNQWV